MKTPLTNTFGFDSSCFVCDPDNEDGLRQQFFHDSETNRVVAEITPLSGHSGAPNYAHGGFTMAVLDDAMAWAVIAIEKKFGLSQRIEFDFQRPVKIERLHTIEAWIDKAEERSVVARAQVRDSRGRVCLAATATYIPMSMDQASQAIGSGAQDASSYTSAR